MIKDFFIPLVVLMVLVAVGYELGHSRVEAEGRAEVAELKRDYERQYADALREAREKQREDARRAFLADLALHKERNAHAREKAELLEKIGAYSGACVFGPEFLGLFNAAIGASCPALPAVSAAGGSGGADAAAGACAGAVQDIGQ